MKEQIYRVPFAYEKYGRIEVTAISKREAVKKAEAKLDEMSVQELEKLSSYLDDSAEIDYDGIIKDKDGNILP